MYSNGSHETSSIGYQLEMMDLTFKLLAIYNYKLSHEKKLVGLGYKWDYTTQLYGDYIKPLQGSPLNNQDSMESWVFFVAQL